MASFRFNPTFDSRLDELSQKLNKTKTAIIVEAVNAYASGVLPDKEVIERLDKISGEVTTTQNSIGNVLTLCLQIIRNQQSTGSA
jgi:predicted DNA-binding protein